MTLRFERPVEALAAITWLICTADQNGSIQERNFLHEDIRRMEQFRDMSPHEFSTMMGSTHTKLFSHLPNNGICLDTEAVSTVIHLALEVLDSDQRREAYNMAVDLTRSDGLHESERIILDQMRQEFGIS